MPKLGARLPQYRKLKRIRKLLIFENQATTNRARYNPGISKHFKEMTAAQNLRFNEAVLAWERLKQWKQFRWHTCALTFGLTGATLYVKNYMVQNTTLGRQPMSPCARRVWDPEANEWDYTP
jgi:hypothetical protein